MHITTGRRAFLKTAVAIGTARFPILGANSRINVGITGLGGRGQDHIEYHSLLKSECRIAAICDINQSARERAAALVRGKTGDVPAEFADLRKMLESKDIDAVSLATPNHWHALGTIWACQAGKDVYVEKPASHNVFESAQMVKAARKYDRVVQVGTQNRSLPHYIHALQVLQSGTIGKVYHARGLCFRRRFSIGRSPQEAVPPGLNWDQFLGPAPLRPYSKNRFAYNWHWFWDTGNGDIGNQGVHEVDVCLWGLPSTGWPKSVFSTGGKFVWDDEQETPNNLQTVFDLDDAQITFDVRNLPTPPEGLGGMQGPNYVGNLFFGALGFMIVDQAGFQVYHSTAGQLSGDAARGAFAGQKDNYEKVMEVKASGDDADDALHLKNFFEAVRARNRNLLHADIEVGARSAAFCHLANISYRVKRALTVDVSSGKLVDSPQASAMLSREYRAPYIVPENV